MSLRELIGRWPFITQIRTGSPGTGADAMSARTHQLRPRSEETTATRSICPFCAVGCGQLIFHRDGSVVSVEGDPESPISGGRLCPKGAATHELLTHAARATRGLSRCARRRRPNTRQAPPARMPARRILLRPAAALH